MSLQEQLLNVIHGVFSPDNATRQKAEELLAQYRDSQPSEFVTAMLHLCRHEELKIRQFAPVYLRNSLSNYSPKSHKNVWSLLAPETQEIVKVSLFQLLELETSSNVRSQLCDTIGELGGSLFEDETKNSWPNLLQTLWQLFLSPKNDLIECGFKILANLFTYAIDLFNKHQADLHTLFIQGLASPDQKIKTATIQAIGNYVTTSEPKQYRAFQDLIPNLMQSALSVTIADQTLGEDIMETFSEIVDAEPKFFRKQINVFFNGIAAIFRESQIEQGLKRIGTETLISLAEKFPRVFKQDKQYLSQLVEMIFFHMIQISQTVTEEWMKPAEGFNDDIQQDEDCETTRFGMSSIDRLIESIGDKEMLPVLSPIVNQLLQHQDWRYKYAAILALSQVGEYIEEVAEVKPIIDLVSPMLSDSNPMIRYAVCHAIGQIADDMKPKFQENYLHLIVPQFLTRLQVEDVPRVTSHILAALTNFVEGTETGIESYLQNLIQLTIQYLNNGISIVKENAMSALAATAESSKQQFLPYVNEIVPLLFQVFQNHQNKEYRQLKGQTIETITLIASAVGQASFQPFLAETVRILIQVQTSQLEAVDPQKSYVLSGWQRLALVCPQQIAVYLPEIIPSLFQLVQQVFKVHTGTADEEFHTYDNEEAEVAIHMLSVFIEELKESFFPYFDSCTQLIVPLCNFNTDENIRSAACKCLVSLIENVKATNNVQQLVNGAKYFLGIILEAAEKEFDPMVIIEQVDCIKEIIDIVGQPFMTTEEVTQLSDKVFKLLLESDKRKAENEKMSKEEDVDEDEKTVIKEETETEEELHVKIAECIGSIFKTHKDQVQPLYEVICNQILPKVLDPTQSPKMHQFGIFLIDDMVEYLGYPYVQGKLHDFAQALTVYAVDKVCFVRQAAVYGIGIMALNTPEQLYINVAPILSKALVDSLKVDKNQDDTEKQHGHARDNSIAALGKIIKYQSKSLGGDLAQGLQTWLHLLPLKYDKPEARLQHEQLADFVIADCNQLINGKPENALQILKVFANTYKTKRSSEAIDTKISSALKVFEQTQGQNVQAIFGMLSQEEQKKLLEVSK
ncbi:unnamed protein product [Paramecium octaurelia]|uniref:TOG domain-containing protein n=1 Tax=Paramecium octaurelia TaxID=43137 RepID=A0A8S1XTJ5_PAROT|nr:unnamed protein product [Paramecium octaurelia]